MKRFITVVLACAFALSLSACSNRFGGNTFNDNENPPMQISAAGFIW